MINNELKIAQKIKELNFINVIKIYDIIDNPKECFIVSELCTSGTLLNYMERNNIKTSTSYFF